MELCVDRKQIARNLREIWEFQLQESKRTKNILSIPTAEKKLKIT
jgi:hypothetical protein